jgi:hypothetical protein
VLGYRVREEGRKSVHAREQEWTREGCAGLLSHLKEKEARESEGEIK